MKKLSKVRLINWYHIEDETIPIQGSVLFMGDNGSGKSTILDAIQFALVADLTQVKFNNAANEQAARSLQGYTRWMTNSGGSKETHQYNRGDCTSYVFLEFTEDDAAVGAFTIGAAVDSFKDSRDPLRLHFIFNQCGIDEIPVFRENTRFPLRTAEFKQLMGPRKGSFLSREPGPYRENLLTRLGRLSPDFTKILVKALAFKPLGQVQQFVMDFLLDERPLETTHLQTNLSHYKALEQKSLEAVKRIEQLDRIVTKGEELAKLRDESVVFRYLELRGMAGIEEERLADFQKGLETASAEKRRLVDELSETGRSCEQTKLELGSLWKSLAENTGYLERERTKDELGRAKERKVLVDATLKLARAGQRRVSECGKELKPFADLHALPLDSDLSNAETFAEAAYHARKRVDELTSSIAAAKLQGQSIQVKIEGLKKGQRPFDREVTTLRQLIEDSLGCRAPLLCELLEVQDEKWQSAIEGYLNTRRFDIILEPKYFQKALSLYEKNKVQLKIHGVGLVDSEKVMNAAPRPKMGSLAEIVTSENPWAKAYADFIMADVIRCEKESELRKHSRAITPTCMVYQNHAARQTAFHIFENWYIGSRGRERLAETLNRQLCELARGISESAALQARWDKLRTLCQELALATEQAAQAKQLESEEESLSEEIKRLTEHLERICSGKLASMEARLAELHALEKQLETRIATIHHEQGSVEARFENIRSAIEATTVERDRKLAELAVEFGSEEKRAKAISWEERYREELQKKTKAAEVVRVFESQRKNRETWQTKIVEELAVLRSSYNNQFGFTAPAQGEDISPYLSEHASWKESHLPDYQAKIERARDLALQQLMEDVVHKLRENLDLIPRQFDEINRALRNFSFGPDRYQFMYRVKRDFESFEKMIREAALYERQPLFETDWRNRFKDGGALEVLFNSMVSGSSETLQKELQQYSDYRQYFDYDLKILHPDGSHSLFSQVSRWKSGGETQTPYYIAVLASLYRLYRLQPERGGKQKGTIGLVILDEAFNKMDEDHAKATLEFTRSLGLQLILATPKERAELIIPHVESCWVVAKDQQNGRAFMLDYHQDLSDAECPRSDTDAPVIPSTSERSAAVPPA